jgi:hypothetical protein
MKKHNQKGVSLLLTLLIMSAILTIAIGISTINIGEITITRESPHSLVAFYAGETGVERALYEDRVNSMATHSYQFDDICLDPENEICYSVTVAGATPTRVITSIGSYKGVERRVEATY